MDNNDDQQSKEQALNLLDQLETDRAMAAALQQQESAFTMLETIESEVEDDEEDEDEEGEIGSSSWTSSNDYDDGNNFEISQEFEAEFEFTEEDDDGEGSYMDDEIEEDDIDPDEMSYEELIALGEIVGEANRGLSIDQINASLSPYVHKIVQCKTIIDRCVICQIEYEEAEQLVALQCQHPFHTECINQWLQIKKVCPICSIEVTPTSNSEASPTNPEKIH